MNSIIKTHCHSNYDILKEFTESPDSILLYKGKPIVAVTPTSNHENLNVNTETGVHGLRYYNKRLEYYHNGKWNNIATGDVVSGDIIISSAANNALTKYHDGYYVPAFLVSSQINNAIVKYSDGYYVPAIPANNATTDDIDILKDELDNKLVKQNQTFNERYDVITSKLLQISSNTTKTKVHEYSGNNPISLDSVIDISTLYDLSSDVILNLEFMIKNNSDTDILNIKILENNIETLKDTLTKSEVQRYKLPNIPNIEIFIKGDYQLFLYVNYV